MAHIAQALRRLRKPRVRRERQQLSAALSAPRTVALIAVAGLVAAASLVSFAESYRALYLWAREHLLHGVWAFAWPLQIDVFIAVGELALFVALADQWQARSRIAAWSVTLTGLAVSVAGNVGHVTGHVFADRATAAVPPIAAAAALAVGLGVLKRVVENHGSAPSERVARDALDAARTALAATVAATNPLSERALIARFGISRADAKSLCAELVRSSMNGDSPDE